MKPTLTSPDISGIEALFEIYRNLPEKEASVDTLASFYEFLQRNSSERQIFLDAYCEYEFMSVGSSVILKLSPR